MNAFDYRTEIEALRNAAFIVNDIAIKIQDSQGGMDNHGDLIAAESEVCHLMLASRLILEQLPFQPENSAVKLLKERDDLRAALHAIESGGIADGTPDRIIITGMQTIARAALNHAKGLTT